MYSREAARTEEDEEGERTQERVTMTAAGMCMTGVGASQPDLMLMFPLMIDAGWQFPFSCWELKLIQLILILTSFVMSAVIWMTHSSLYLIPSCLLSWFGLFVFSFLFWPFQQLDTSPCYFPPPPAVINHWIWSFLCVCVFAVERTPAVEKRYGALAVHFIFVLCCLPCAGGTPGWTCAMAPATLMFDRAGVARKHGLKKKVETEKDICGIVALLANGTCVCFSVLESHHPFSCSFPLPNICLSCSWRLT